jgi:hypothetical protein
MTKFYRNSFIGDLVACLQMRNRARICKSLRSPGIDSQRGAQPYLSYQPVRPRRLAESIPVLLIRSQIRKQKWGNASMLQGPVKSNEEGVEDLLMRETLQLEQLVNRDLPFLA